jgi:hypothetical protein
LERIVVDAGSRLELVNVRRNRYAALVSCGVLTEVQ